MNADYQLGRDLPTDALPFSALKQTALLGYLLMKESFFRLCKDRLLPGWFLDPRNQIIWTTMLAHQELHNRPPRATEVLDSPSTKPEDTTTKERLKQQVRDCLLATKDIGLDVLQNELTVWLRARKYQETLETSYRLYKSQKLEEAWAKLQVGVRDADKIKFVEEEVWNFDNYAEHFDETENEINDAVTTGSDLLDHILNPEAKKGALLKGDVTYFVGSVNTGKTRVLITLVRHNVKKLKKNVLYLTHEGRHRQIESLLLASMLSNPPNMLVTPQMIREEFYRTEAGRKALDHVVRTLKEHVEYLPINKAGMTIEDVTTAIRRRQDVWAANHGGRGFDLVVDDYPMKLVPKDRYKEKRHDQGIVSDFFVQLALELDVHVVGAYQTNREGSKIQKGRSRDHAARLLDMEDAGESWEPMQNIANVITINRDAAAKARKVIIFNIAKSRTGETGVAVVVGGDFGACITHCDSMGVTAYRGNASTADVVDTLLEQFPNQVAPRGIVNKTE